MYKRIAQRLDQAKRICIISHITPDGDTLGSAAALYLYLMDQNKDVIWVCENEVPHAYKDIYGMSFLSRPDNITGEYDVCVCIDITDIERCGSAASALKLSSTVINIDHHISNTRFGHINLVRDVSSCAELIYRLLKNMNDSIDISTAVLLYTAISTDTGSFSYSNTTPSTHFIVSKLLKTGMDVASLCRKLFRVRTLEKTKLTGIAATRVQTAHNGGTAYIVLTQQDFSLSGAADADTEGLVDYARDIEGVEIAFLVREYDNNTVKVSLRSNSDKFDVSSLASFYGGGGHKMAAGFNHNSNAQSITVNLLDKIDLLRKQK